MSYLSKPIFKSNMVTLDYSSEKNFKLKKTMMKIFVDESELEGGDNIFSLFFWLFN